MAIGGILRYWSFWEGITRLRVGVVDHRTPSCALHVLRELVVIVISVLEVEDRFDNAVILAPEQVGQKHQQATF